MFFGKGSYIGAKLVFVTFQAGESLARGITA